MDNANILIISYITEKETYYDICFNTLYMKKFISFTFRNVSLFKLFS